MVETGWWMEKTVKSSVADGVAFLVVEDPPANVLSVGSRLGLIERLKLAVDDPAVQEIVLLGHGSTFPTQPDVSEYDEPTDGPSLSDLCLAVENCEKPVVAAIHGTAFGGAFELALAAHYRIAHSHAKVGFPNVKLGIAPNAGGTQRGARLMGAKLTLDLLLSGVSVAVTDKRLAPVFDWVTDKPLAQAALAFCTTLRAKDRGPRKTSKRTLGFRDFQAYSEEIRRRRALQKPLLETAPKEIVSCVEAAALLPFEAGLEFETVAFETTFYSDQSRALRHAFQAERRCLHGIASAIEGIKDLQTLVVLGGGVLALSLVRLGLDAGLSVRWGVRDPDVRSVGLATLRAEFQPRDTASVERLNVGSGEEMVVGADVILLAAPGQSAIAATQPAPRIKVFSDRIDGVGLRFLTPIPSARLAEIIRGPNATGTDLKMAAALCRKFAKLPVITTSTGYTNTERLAASVYRAADGLVDYGLSPYAIDAALFEWGWTRPPFLLRDMRGVTATSQLPRAKGCHNWAAVVAELGREGQATGAGFYDFPEEGAPTPSGEVQAAIDKRRPSVASLSSDDIVKLVIGAMANEGARMISGKWSRCPSDIDVASMLGFDFPRFRGGPMQAADQFGLFTLANKMKKLDHPDTAFWTPHPIIIELIKNGYKFSDLNDDMGQSSS